MSEFKSTQDKSTQGKVARVFYLFKIGYNSYLTFGYGAGETLIIVYSLYVAKVPWAAWLFPDITRFCLVGIPLTIGLGYVLGVVHFKLSKLFTAETEVGIEANKYFYIIPNGYNRVAWNPAYYLTLKNVRLIGQKLGTLSPEDEKMMIDTEKQFEKLIAGQGVDLPKKGQAGFV